MKIVIGYSPSELSGEGEEWLLDCNTDLPLAKFWNGNIVKSVMGIACSDSTNPQAKDNAYVYSKIV